MRKKTKVVKTKTKGKRKVMDCEHLNVGTTKIDGVDKTVCKDCKTPVEMKELPEVKMAAPVAPPAPPAQVGVVDLLPFLKTGKTLIKVSEFKINGVVKLPKLDAFFPVFEAKAGDVLVVYRPQ